MACVVASGGDAALCGARPVVLVEHGAGQAYDRPSPSYSGGPGRDNCVLFLCPNETSAQRNRVSYPAATVEVVGSARLDDLRTTVREGDGRPPNPPVVALSFHWDCPFVPETRWAYPHYKRTLPAVVERWSTIGHGHPRFAGAFTNRWRDLGVDHVRNFTDVFASASVYVCDNSSSMYEWAALGKPVVVLNAPTYRRDVDLWPRFWRCADVGLQVDDPRDLVDTIVAALEDPPDVAARRAEIVDEVWPLRDGKAAQRSAGALRGVLSSLRSIA